MSSRTYKSTDFTKGKIALNRLFFDIVRDRTLGPLLVNNNGDALFALTRTSPLKSNDQVVFESSLDLEDSIMKRLDTLVAGHSPDDDDYTATVRGTEA